MTPLQIQMTISAIQIVAEAIKQARLNGLESLPPEVRTALLADRDSINAEWARLAPKA